MSTSKTAVDRVADELTAPLTALGLDIEAVELTPAGKRRVLRVAVDQDGGVTLEDVAAAAREINRVLDDSDALGEQPYTLEVTSRGVERPLTLPRHWRRNAGRLVKVTRHDGEPVTGRITDSDDSGVRIEVAGEQRRIDYDEIVKALVQVEFNRPPPPDPVPDDNPDESPDESKDD